MARSTLIRHEVIQKTLGHPTVPGKKLLEPLKSLAAENQLPFQILEDSQVTNASEIHEHEGDLWQCLEGEITFICGGKLVNPEKHTKKEGEWKGSGIEGGTEYVLKYGDWLWIPAGEAHLHKTSGIARMIIIKIPLLTP